MLQNVRHYYFLFEYINIMFQLTVSIAVKFNTIFVIFFLQKIEIQNYFLTYSLILDLCVSYIHIRSVRFSSVSFQVSMTRSSQWRLRCFALNTTIYYQLTLKNIFRAIVSEICSFSVKSILICLLALKFQTPFKVFDDNKDL